MVSLPSWRWTFLLLYLAKFLSSLSRILPALLHHLAQVCMHQLMCSYICMHQPICSVSLLVHDILCMKCRCDIKAIRTLLSLSLSFSLSLSPPYPHPHSHTHTRVQTSKLQLRRPFLCSYINNSNFFRSTDPQWKSPCPSTSLCPRSQKFSPSGPWGAH